MNLSLFRRTRQPVCGRCAGHGTIQGIRFGTDGDEAFKEPCPQCVGCGCSPPAYCPTAQQILIRVDRGERLAGETGSWATHTQALVELAVHLDREPSTVRAMLRHPVGRL